MLLSEEYEGALATMANKSVSRAKSNKRSGAHQFPESDPSAFGCVKTRESGEAFKATKG
jgi:hypothetical protein